MRTVLSYLAHSRFVAYLDDDNWWAPDHLSALRQVTEGNGWAFSRRWFLEPGSSAVLCEDIWQSLGPDAGVYAQKFGGWSDPNTLMIDKVLCGPLLRVWCYPLPNEPSARTADRLIFHNLKNNFTWGQTGRPVVYYRIDPEDSEHPRRWARVQKGLAGKDPAGKAP